MVKNQNPVEHPRNHPTGNALHVTFMYHAIIIDLHALHNMHVVMLMYMNVSCNMHGFRTLSMHVTCIQHDYKHYYNMHVIWETKT